VISQIQYDFIKTENKLRFNQGDIVRDVAILMHTGYENEQAEIREINLKYGIVISQECDLEHDHNNREDPNSKSHDKFLPNILILPAYLAEEFRTGRHLGSSVPCITWGSDLFKKIKQNNDARFQYIKESNNYQIPELIIDFKHIYAVNRNVLYAKLNSIYLATICELFREHLSVRYSQYLSRIGLPIIN